LDILDRGASVHDAEDARDAPMAGRRRRPRDPRAPSPSVEWRSLRSRPPQRRTRPTQFFVSWRRIQRRREDRYPLAAAAGSRTGTAANRRLIVERLLAEGADPNREGGRPSALAGAVAACDDDRPDAGECMLLVSLLLGHGARLKGDALGAALSLDDRTRTAPLDALLALPAEPGVTAIALAYATSADPA